MGNAHTGSAEPSSLKHPDYRPDIDGLRAVAVAAVVLFHAFPTVLTGGFVGVDVFFVISGFLISKILYENLQRGTFSFAEFYRRRVRRIFPALALVLATSLAAGWLLLPAVEFKQLGKHVAGGAAFVSNFVLRGESGYFDNAAETKPLLHLWSLGVEEQFYLAWPALVYAAWRWRRSALALCVLVGAASFAINIAQRHIDPVGIFYSPLTRFWELLVGAILAHRTSGGQLARGQTSALGHVASAVGAVLIAAAAGLLTRTASFPGWWALAPVGGAALLICAGPQALVNRHLLSRPAAVWLGLISFPLYLWHWPILSFLALIGSGEPAVSVRRAAVVASVLLAAATYYCVERPFRQGGAARRKVLLLCGGVVLAGALGAVVYARDGLPDRAHMQQYVVGAPKFMRELWPYTTNETCLRRYRFEDATRYPWWFCMASRDAAPTLVVLGNSYANQLYPGLASNRWLRHHSILSIGDCDPAEVDPPGPAAVDESHPCTAVRQYAQQRFIDQLIASLPSIRYVLLAGLEPTPTPEYTLRLERRVESLESRGIRVILFTPHLIPPFNIEGCVPRPLAEKRNTCELGLEAHALQQQRFAPLVAAMSKAHPRVLVFDQNVVFCDARTCSMLRNGQLLLRDHTHISEFGSRLVAASFADWARSNVVDLLDGAAPATAGSPAGR